jgi:hypothetical protein
MVARHVSGGHSTNGRSPARSYSDVVFRPSRQAGVIGCLLLVGGVWAWLLAARSEPRAFDAGFWFEPVTFASAELDGPLTAHDLEVISTIAASEIERAFAGLRLTLSDRRDATYRVRVVQELRDPRFRSQVEVAGASWPVSDVGGQGAVSFRFLANGAMAHAPPGADRATKIEAIGRGIGRSAVHELAHLLLPTEAIHGSDAQSYEFESASRREQYYGAMHWDVAWPLLQKQFGIVSPRQD